MSQLPRTIKTSRQTLEAIDLNHAEDLDRAVEVSRSNLERWLAWIEDYSSANERAFIARASEGWDRGEEWVFALVVDGEAVGTIGLDMYNKVLNRAEIGYWVRADLAGRGLVTEAASAVVHWAFANLGLHRIELHAGTENVASVRVAQKLGFRREGLLRDGSKGSFGYYDVYVFGLLENDPRASLY